MKKNFLLISISCYCILNANAQKPGLQKCGSDITYATGYPKQLQRIISNNPGPVLGKTFTVPVVFHVFKNAAFKSDYYDFLLHVNVNTLMPKIIKQINENFNNQSPYLKYTPKVFTDVAGVGGINLCLAQRTPTGEATTGVIYHPEIYDTLHNEKNYHKAYGSPLDKYIWDIDKYVNVFLIPLPAGNSLVGETHFSDEKVPDGVIEPGYDGSQSKIFINATAIDMDPEFYKNGKYFYPEEIEEFANKDFSVVRHLSSVITHELGHYWGLDHIAKETCSDDGFSDTPLQFSMAYNVIPAYPLFDQCNKDDGKSNGVMFYNFEDAYYFTSMFTKQQCTSMQDYLEKKYPSLPKSDGCTLGSCVEDDFEPNESIDNATDLNFPASYLATLCKDDKDFYRITLPFKQSIKVKLLNLPEDYSLGLSYEKDGEFILDESDEDGKASEVLIANEVEGAVYIEVSSKKGGYHPLHDYFLAIESSLGTYDKQGNEITSLSNGAAKSSAINPNPSNGQINISFGENFKQGSIVKMTISDMYGNKKLEKQITITGDRLPVDVSNLKDDIYLVNLTGQNVNETHRLVIKK